MPLPAPRLDDRHFQDLVDEAKRLVQQRCPEWSDHNVSDPGVTLIEAFAQMVDQLIYRLNRVPDRHYVKFLELIGVELLPPAPARGQVTFWLSAPQPQTVHVRAESQVATARTDVEDAVVFSTTEGLDIVSCEFHAVATSTGAQPARDRSTELPAPDGFACFSARPVADDALLVGLTEAVPSCAVLVRVDCPVRGVGIDPDDPPLRWEALTPSGWMPCEVERDGTGGLNHPGDVVVHVPRHHRTAVLAGHRAGWLRCRLVPSRPGQGEYTHSPRIRNLTAFTVGGTVDVLHGEVVHDEELGTSDGTPGQRFPLRRRPVVRAGRPTFLEVGGGDARRPWTAVEHFAESGSESAHYRLDAAAGEVQLGPAVRQVDGTLRRYGAVPRKGDVLRLTAYHTGGGRRGNVGRGRIRVLKTSVPYVGRVENRVPAVGGADGESVDDAKLRGPVVLHSRGRAVTAEDFEHLAREAAPGAARVACVAVPDGPLPDGSRNPEAGAVRLLVVPQVAGDAFDRMQRRDLDPPEAMLAAITAALDARRLVGTRLLVAPPQYVGLTVVVSATAREGYRPDDVREDVLRALYRLFHPVEGGPDGSGWRFGRAVRAHEVHAALAALPGVDMSEDVRVQLFPADTGTGRRAGAVDRLDLPPHGLVFSFDHQVRVVR